MEKCSAYGCREDAIGYNVYFYHDYSVVGYGLTCESHSVVDRPSSIIVYDDYGYSIYRPDPIFIWLDTYNNPDDKNSSIVNQVKRLQSMEKRIGYNVKTGD